MKTITSWVKGQEFESSHDEQVIKLDGERINGFSPKAVLLSAIAACSGIDIVEILEKMKIKVTKLDITVESEVTETHPKIFKEIHMVYKISSTPVDEAKTKKAINLSLDKYCGVAAMLKKNSQVTYEIEYF
jgi:putative redox protein